MLILFDEKNLLREEWCMFWIYILSRLHNIIGTEKF